MFEAGTPGLLPACPQCGGKTVPVIKIEPSRDHDRDDDGDHERRTLKFRHPQLLSAR
jgi:hypothetical protein